MNTALTHDEQSYLASLLHDKSRSLRSLRATANALLLFGGFLLAGTAIYLSRNLTDVSVYSVGFPNFCGGILLVVCGIILFRRATNAKILHSILLKLARTSLDAQKVDGFPH